MMTLSCYDEMRRLAGESIPSFVCKPDKTPGTEHGYLDASCSERDHKRWRNAAAMGVPTGDRFFVVDTDPRNGGDQSLAQLLAEHGPFPETVRVRTGGDGDHYWFTMPAGMDIACSNSQLAPGIDIKGRGGYVLTPPSRHESGRLYRYVGKPLTIAAIAPAPEWLLTRITEAADRPATGSSSSNSDDTIPQGRRNETLFKFGCSMRARGAARGAIVAALEAMNTGQCRPPLSDAEVGKVVASVMRHDPGQPDDGASWSVGSGPKGATVADDLLRKPWPTLGKSAFCGLAGDIVRTIEPHTESDPVAILAQLVTFFGNAVGRGPYFPLEADRHYMNFYVVLVGNTSKARKGTSAGHVRSLFVQPEELGLGDAIAVDDDLSVGKPWGSANLASGLASGEGVIWIIRDQIEQKQPIKEKGVVTGYQVVVVDGGVPDKRLLVIEPEFSRVLQTMGREGNTLSAIIRTAWDSGDLRSLTKASPARATGAHVSIIAHITAHELRKRLTETEAANGFANRFLFVAVKRSKLLPDGGAVPKEALEGLSARVREAVRFAQGVTQITRSDTAAALWREVYPALSQGRPGALGSLTSRAEAQVLRLSCIYALLNKSAVIEQAHLEAALALWEYSEASVQYIFGTGNDDIDTKILALVKARPEGVSLTDIQKAFNRNIKAAALREAVASLLEAGLIEEGTRQGVGRPVTILRPVTQQKPYEKNEKTN